MYNFLHNLFDLPTVFAQTADKNPTIASQTSDKIQNLAENIITAIPLWITGGLVIVVSFVIAKIVKSAVENKMAEEGLEEEHREVQIVAGRASSAAVLTIGVTIGLKIAGIDLTAVLAAAAFGIGFAMKDIIMNFMAGMIVLLQKQFTIGDWIKIGKTMGVIEAIQSRYTIIRNFDGTKVIIPNGDLFKKQVTNLTAGNFRRFQLDLPVDLYQNLTEVIKVIYEGATKVKSISMVPKPPSIRVLPPSHFCNNLRIRCWAVAKKGVLKPKSDLVKQLHKEFYKRGWSWPYPTQKLILDKDAQPDVNERAKKYIEKHKKSLKKKAPVVSSAQTISQAAPVVLQELSIVQAAPVTPIPSAETSQVQVQPLPAANVVAVSPAVTVPPIGETQAEIAATILPLPDVQPVIAPQTAAGETGNFYN